MTYGFGREVKSLAVTAQRRQTAQMTERNAEGRNVVGTIPPLQSGVLIEIDPTNIIAPFPIRRVYWIYRTVADAVRGNHAHKALWQLMVCPVGSCVVTLQTGDKREDYVLDSPVKGLLVGPNVWREMRHFSPNCVLTVLASLPYDECDYIRDFQEFQKLGR